MDTDKLADLIKKENEQPRRHFDVVAESLRTDISKVAEGVLATNERLDRHAEEMRKEFVEVRSMIKFSYSELDRRVSHLEDTVSDLSARVQRIEPRP
jgi:galactokinase